MTILKEGDSAPNFKLTDNEGKFHSLKDYSGEKLIIFFYPRLNFSNLIIAYNPFSHIKFYSFRINILQLAESRKNYLSILFVMFFF